MAWHAFKKQRDTRSHFINWPHLWLLLYLCLIAKNPAEAGFLYKRGA